MRRWILSTILVLSSFSQVFAGYEDTLLFSKGYWTVELTYNTDENSYWCSAKTANRRSQEFSVTAFENGTIVVFIFDNRWSLAKRPVRFLIDIDYSRWQIDGTADDIAVSIALSNNEKAGKFITELAQGSAVALFNMEERRLATFSLKGSRAALTELIDCWRKISVTDPFRTSTDPF